MVKVTIRVKQISNLESGNYWAVTLCNVPTDPNTNKLLSSGEQYPSKDEAVDEMKQRARVVLGKKKWNTSDEDIAWDIREVLTE